jgi:hypothetical protein
MRSSLPNKAIIVSASMIVVGSTGTDPAVPYSVLGGLMVSVIMALTATTILAALFGRPRLSKRAFRLITRFVEIRKERGGGNLD